MSTPIDAFSVTGNNICKLTAQRIRESCEAHEYQTELAKRIERDVKEQFAPCAYSLRLERDND